MQALQMDDTNHIERIGELPFFFPKTKLALEMWCEFPPEPKFLCEKSSYNRASWQTNLYFTRKDIFITNFRFSD